MFIANLYIFVFCLHPYNIEHEKSFRAYSYIIFDKNKLFVKMVEKQLGRMYV